jgi:hypothetical protein
MYGHLKVLNSLLTDKILKGPGKIILQSVFTLDLPGKEYIQPRWKNCKREIGMKWTLMDFAGN